MSRWRGFSLIELLVVIGIIGLLLAMAIPALNGARQSAMTARCLTNMRNLEQAHWSFMAENNGRLVDAGLGHGSGAHEHEEDAWIHTLRQYYDADKLLRRSPVDDSPYWPPEEGGTGETASNGEHRQTSYGINNYLVPGDGQAEGGVSRLSQVPQPGRTVHFLLMTFDNPDYAAADHPHVDDWHFTPNPDLTPARAQQQVQINAHGGEPGSWEAVSVYGFLDGSARSMSFNEVYEDLDHNLFNPKTTIR